MNWTRTIIGGNQYLLQGPAYGRRQWFPSGISCRIREYCENMIEFYSNICFPDYSNPCFSDAKLGDRPAEVRNYQDWLKLFPDCDWIRYYATEGREGSPYPTFLTEP